MNIDNFLKEGKNHKFSSSRLLASSWGLGVLVVWIVTSVISTSKGGGLQPIPESVVTILGILVGGKTLQRFGENEKSE